MKNVISMNETTADIELVREALSESMIWCPSEYDNDKPCMIRDAQEAFERINTRIAALEVENTRLRVRIAHIHNHELHDIQNQIDQVFLQWLSKVRAANREALRPPTT